MLSDVSQRQNSSGDINHKQRMDCLLRYQALINEIVSKLERMPLYEAGPMLGTVENALILTTHAHMSVSHLRILPIIPSADK